MNSKFLEWLAGSDSHILHHVCKKNMKTHIWIVICITVSPLHTSYKRVKLGVWNNKKKMHKHNEIEEHQERYPIYSS